MLLAILDRQCDGTLLDDSGDLYTDQIDIFNSNNTDLYQYG